MIFRFRPPQADHEARCTDVDVTTECSDSAIVGQQAGGKVGKIHLKMVQVLTGKPLTRGKVGKIHLVLALTPNQEKVVYDSRRNGASSLTPNQRKVGYDSLETLLALTLN
jgi:hypothetical protein